MANSAIAEPAAAVVDALCHRHLLPPAEHGNLAHLHQVDAHRVVNLAVLAGRFARLFLVHGLVQRFFRRRGGHAARTRRRPFVEPVVVGRMAERPGPPGARPCPATLSPGAPFRLPDRADAGSPTGQRPSWRWQYFGRLVASWPWTRLYPQRGRRAGGTARTSWPGCLTGRSAMSETGKSTSDAKPLGGAVA